MTAKKAVNYRAQYCRLELMATTKLMPLSFRWGGWRVRPRVISRFLSLCAAMSLFGKEKARLINANTQLNLPTARTCAAFSRHGSSVLGPSIGKAEAIRVETGRGVVGLAAGNEWHTVMATVWSSTATWPA